MLFKGRGKHGYYHTGNGIAYTCDACEKGNLTEVDRWQDEDFDADNALHLPWSCLRRGMMLVITQIITYYYTLLHGKLGILTRWQVNYLNQEIDKFNSNHPLRGHAAVIDPSDDIQASLVFGHFSKKSLSVNLCLLLHAVTRCYTRHLSTKSWWSVPTESADLVFGVFYWSMLPKPYCGENWTSARWRHCLHASCKRAFSE